MDKSKHIAKVDHDLVATQMTDYDAKIDGAEQADRQEREQSIWSALRQHKKAVAWSAFLSASLILEGYDLVIINSFYGQNQFIEKYGSIGKSGQMEISAPWQNGLSNSALCGQIIGLAINGWASQRFGYRRTMLAAMAFMAVAIFPVFFAPSLPVLAFGEVMCGIPWGIFQTLSTAYAADICPISLRPLLTSYVNMCWGFGILLSSGVARGAIDLDGSLAYKLPFALQWVWPPILFAGAYFCPESPYWLVRNGKQEEAFCSLQRLSGSGDTTQEELRDRLALIEHTDAIEQAQVAGTTYLDCFRGVNRRRTEIACAVWATQWWCGNPLIGFAVTFLRQSGLSEKAAFDFNLGMNSMYFVGTVISWGLMSRFGRRSLYIAGLVIMMVICVAIAVAGFTDTPLVVGILMIILNLGYNVSIGPVCYCIVAEIGSARLRPMTVVLARTTYNLTGLVTNTITPRMIQPSEWGWGARCGLFWFGTAGLCLIYCFFRLPETKGRSFAEIDLLFENKIGARHFSKTNVDQFDNHTSLGGEGDCQDNSTEKA